MAANRPPPSLRLAGLIALSHPPRPDSAALIAKQRSMGVRTVMVTGDAAPKAAGGDPLRSGRKPGRRGRHSRVRGGSARGRMMMPRWRIRIIPYFNEHRSGARSEADDRFRDPVPTPVRKRTLTDEIGAKVIDMAAARARHPRRLEPRVGIDCSIRGFSARGNRKTRGLMPRILEAMSTLARLWR